MTPGPHPAATAAILLFGFWVGVCGLPARADSPDSPAQPAAAVAGGMLVYSSNFEGAIGAEWSNRNTDVTPVNGRRFLGQFASQMVTLTLTNLPPHNNATVALDLFLIQTWDGNDPGSGPDVWELRVANGPTLLHTTFATHNLINNNITNRTQAFPGNYPGIRFPVLIGAAEVSTLGYLWSWPGVMDGVYHLVYNFNHSDTRLQLDFSGYLNGTGVGDESWGLGNVQVTVDNAATNGPPTFVVQPRTQIGLEGQSLLLTAQAASLSAVEYQWQRNGTNLPGETNAYLAFTNLDSGLAGAYAVIAGNLSGNTTSQVSQLMVVDAPRRSQVATEGANLSFTAKVAGASAVRYRWRCNDREIIGATNATLTLPSVTTAQTGNYSVDLQTPAGQVRAPPFKLTVNIPANQVVYQTDFQDLLVGREWSLSERALTPRDRRSVLGFFGNNLVTLTLTNLPPHTEVNLALDVIGVMTLDGNASPPGGPDIWRVQVNGLPGSQFQTTFNAFRDGPQAYPGSYPGGSFPGRSGAAEIGTLGFQEWYGSIVDYPSGLNNLDAVYHLELQFQHTNSTLVATFSGANQEGLWNEGWAIGNVVVSVAQVASNSAPQIVAAPVSQFARAGDPVVFQAGATLESPTSYQWSFNGQNLTGQTNAYLVIPSAQGTDVGQYWVTVSNLYGAASRPAHLSVLTRDPIGQSVNAGDPVMFTTAAEPETAQYQWRLNGAHLAGQTNVNLVLPNATSASQGTYQVLVSDGYSSILSLDAGLTVAPLGQPGSVQWVYYEGSSFWSTPAVAPDGTVYAGATSGNLYALDGLTGDLHWKLKLQGTIDSSPVVGSDGRVYVVAGQTLYAVNRLGVVQWQTGPFAFGRPTTLPALGPNGMIYMAGGLDATASARLLQAINPDGTIPWTYSAPGMTPSSAVVGPDGSILFEANNPSETLALNPNGPVKWSTAAGNPFNASPALALDGTVYSCAANGSVFALNPTNGVNRWTLRTLGLDMMTSSPAIGDGGVIYVGSDKGKLLAIASDGTPRWAFHAGGPIRSTPAISAAGSIYFTAYDGKLYCLDSSGMARWDLAIGSPIPYVLENWFEGSPVIGPDGAVYVGSREGRLYRVKGDAGPAHSSWPQFHGNAQHTGSLADDPSGASQITAFNRADDGTVRFKVLTTPERYVDVFASEDLQTWTWLTNVYNTHDTVQFNLTVPLGQKWQFFRAAVP